MFRTKTVRVSVWVEEFILLSKGRWLPLCREKEERARTGGHQLRIPDGGTWI